MFFSAASTAVFGLAALAAAQDTVAFNPIHSPERFEVWEPGSTHEITWTAQPEEFLDDTVTLTLIGGAEQDLQVPLFEIASGVPNSDEKYEWTLPADEGGKAFYGISMVLDSDPTISQFSNPFNISAPEGGEGGESSTMVVSETSTETVILSSASETSSVETTMTIPTTSSPAPTDEETDGPIPNPTVTPSSSTIDGGSIPDVTTTSSPDAAPKATAGAMALLGVAAVAALAL